MAQEITLSTATRTNLLSLQNTTGLIGRTQERLASGLKVNVDAAKIKPPAGNNPLRIVAPLSGRERGSRKAGVRAEPASDCSLEPGAFRHGICI